MIKFVRALRRLAGIGCAASLLGAAWPAAAGPFWNGVGRALPVTPLGNTIAGSCHN